VARQLARLIAVALLVAACGTAAAQGRERERPSRPQTPWGQLSPDERRILAPVQREWSSMPGYQQERLKGAARHYPNMQPIQKERFEERIRDWAAMSPEQRRAARETFRGMRQLPPEKQHELRERWLQRHRPAEESSEPRFRERGGGYYRERSPGEGRPPR
jgi:hypothetical protein